MKTENDNIVTGAEEWSGITIEELRFKRATSLIKLEMQKQNLMTKFNNQVSAKQKGPLGLVSSLGGKFSILQYIILGYKGYLMASGAINFFSKFKRKRR